MKSTLLSAIEELKQRQAKFDESIDIAVKTNLDTKKYSIRSSVKLPHSVNLQYSIVSFSEQKIDGTIALTMEEIIQKIKDNSLKFDRCIADEKGMQIITKEGLSQKLGSKGLMPNKKLGTLSNDIQDAYKIAKYNTFYRNDKQGIIHGSIGKLSFDNNKLIENIHAFISSISHTAQENKLKGEIITKVYISTTQGKGILVEI